MKKALSLVLALVLCLGLCACGIQTDKLSADEAMLIGEWQPTSTDHSDRTLVFLTSGKGIFVTNSSGYGLDFDWGTMNGKVYIMDHDPSSISGLTNMYEIRGTSLDNSYGSVAFNKKN